MLPKQYRFHNSSEFKRIMKNGVKQGSRSVVVYVLFFPLDTVDEEKSFSGGLIVSKAVGNSVVRHTVSRKLRAALFNIFISSEVIPDNYGMNLVVRALPHSSRLSSSDLETEIEHSVTKAFKKFSSKNKTSQ